MIKIKVFKLFFKNSLEYAHNHRPWQGSEDVFHEGGAAHGAGGEYLDQVTAALLGVYDLGDGAATGAVGHSTAVCYGDYFIDTAGGDQEIGTHLDVEAGGGGVQDGSCAKGHFGALCAYESHELFEHLVCAVAAVREFEGADSAVVAGLHHLLGEFDIGIVEHRHNTCAADDVDCVNLVEFCHSTIVLC